MKAAFPIIKNAGIWVSIGAIVMIISLVLFVTNFRASIQFTGGIQVKVDGVIDPKAQSDLVTLPDVSQIGINTEMINDKQYTTILAQVDTQDDTAITAISQQLQKTLVDKGYISDTSKIVESSIVGPSIGEYLTRSARNTVIIGLLLMAGYMVFAFAGVRQYIQPQVLAIITIMSMLFDVIMPMGIYGIKMMIDPTTQVDVIFVIALLTTMGYSINDTIIIFDRIRENLNHLGTKVKDIGQVFEDSLWQTMSRSIGTSLSTFLVVLTMYLIGTGDLSRFAFSMGIGVLSGSLSSIFLAAPLAYLIIKYTHKSDKKHK